MDNIYKAVQLTIDSQNLALSKTPTHVYIANQYVDTNDTPLITAPFIIQKALENGTGVVDIVSSTIGSIYEVRLLCDAEVLISGYFYMPPMNVNFSELELYTSYPPRTPPVVNEFWQKTENFILEKTNTLLNFVQVFNSLSSMRLSLGYLEELLTTKKSNLVSAINEVYKRYEGVGDLYEKNVEAGAGANGWTAELIVDKSEATQQQVNYNGGSKWHSRVVGYLKNERAVLANGDIVKSTVDGNTNDPNVDLSTWRFDKECYYASDFAKPNTQEPQGVALQYGYAKATSEGKCFVIDDVFWVSATENNSGSPAAMRCAINVLSNSVLLFSGKGCLKVIPNNKSNYNIIIAHSGVKDYRIISPNIIGDRYSHDYSSGGTHEWGYGLCIYESSDGLIINPKIADTTGDGLYIGKAWNTQSTDVPKNITVLDPLIKNARRNGIGFTSGDNVNIVRPVIIGTIGTAPETGIDIEPEGSDRINFPPYIKNSRISNPTLIDNKIAIATPIFGDVHVDLVFDGATTIINDSSPVQISGIVMSTRPEIQSDPIPRQTGSITFDHVFYKRKPTAPTYFAALIDDYTSTGLPIEFNQITCDAGSNPLYALGVYTNPLLKNRTGVKIRNFNIIGNYKFRLECADSTKVTFGQKIHLPDNIEVDVNSGYAHLLEFTNDSYIGGFSRLAGRNGISSKYLTNNVVFDSVAWDSEIYRFVVMSNDTREHNFSVLNTNLGTSQGFRLVGINYLGKTTGLSNEVAPFINIKNTADTQIKNYSLGWDFRVYRYTVPTTVVNPNSSVVVNIPITYFEKSIVSSKPQYSYWFEVDVNQHIFARFEKSQSGGRLVIANISDASASFDENTLYVKIT